MSCIWLNEDLLRSTRSSILTTKMLMQSGWLQTQEHEPQSCLLGFLQKQQAAKAQGVTIKWLQDEQQEGQPAHTRTQRVSDGNSYVRQGDVFGNSSNFFFPQPATPPAFFPPTDSSGSLTLPTTSYPSSSLSTKSHPICSLSDHSQTHTVPVSPSFMDTPKKPRCFFLRIVTV